MKVDTTLSQARFSVAAYQFRVLALGEKVLAAEFAEVPCEVLFQDVERAGGECARAGACACWCVRIMERPL